MGLIPIQPKSQQVFFIDIDMLILKFILTYTVPRILGTQYLEYIHSP